MALDEVCGWGQNVKIVFHKLAKWLFQSILYKCGNFSGSLSKKWTSYQVAWQEDEKWYDLSHIFFILFYYRIIDGSTSKNILSYF